MSIQPDQLTVLLSALGEHLTAMGGDPVDLVVCGGTAMNVQGFVKRPTRDVDIVALLEVLSTKQKQLLPAAPLPDSVQKARALVAADFDIPEDWLNAGPADLLRCGLPQGCEDRLKSQSFGSHLTLHFLDRFDLICLKLYAWADTATPRHGQDLRAMEPSPGELEVAAEWVMTHNEPDGFLPLLQEALKRLGAADVAAKLG